MTAEEIAKLGEIEIVRCDEEWGGTYAIKHTYGTWCGFETYEEAVRDAMCCCHMGECLRDLCWELLRNHN